MRHTLESNERALMLIGADLVGQACSEAQGPRAVMIVERLVAGAKEAGPDFTSHLFGTRQWQKFRVLYPVAADRLEKEVRG